jgi:pimeloyl-ACP methyl ester carboxylesterase
MSAVTSVTADAHATLEARVARFPAQQIWLASQRAVSYREVDGAGSGALPLVLLHGIGSGAASWVQQFEMLGATRRVLAWDAPGYGASTPVAADSPAAADYASVLKEWLDALGIERCVLLGHSLGAIIAGAFAVTHAQRVAGLLLLSPAGGYGAASAEVRNTKRDQRLAMLNELGPQGLAEQRSTNMLSAHASDEARAWPRICSPTPISRATSRATRAASTWPWAPTTPLPRPKPANASRWPRAPSCRSCLGRGTPAISKHPPRTPRSSTRSVARATDNGANE